MEDVEIVHSPTATTSNSAKEGTQNFPSIVGEPKIAKDLNDLMVDFLGRIQSLKRTCNIGVGNSILKSRPTERG